MWSSLFQTSCHCFMSGPSVTLLNAVRPVKRLGAVQALICHLKMRAVSLSQTWCKREREAKSYGDWYIRALIYEHWLAPLYFLLIKPWIWLWLQLTESSVRANILLHTVAPLVTDPWWQNLTGLAASLDTACFKHIASGVIAPTNTHASFCCFVHICWNVKQGRELHCVWVTFELCNSGLFVFLQIQECRFWPK